MASIDLDIGGCPADAIGFAWQVTTLLLKQTDAAGALRIVRLREAYLEELDRRDPVGLAIWVRRAARGELTPPDTYIRRNRTSVPTESYRTGTRIYRFRFGVTARVKYLWACCPVPAYASRSRLRLCRSRTDCS
jgi:hypothetical protein